MNPQEDAYARARKNDFSGMEESFTSASSKPTVTGVPANMDRLIAAVQSSGWDPIYQAQMLGAVFFDVETQRRIAEAAKAQGEAGASSDDAALESAIQAEVRAQKVRIEAERRVAGENYSGTAVMSWDEMRKAETRFIIQDLVPEDAVCFLVAKPNLGKTFGYIDAVCRMAAGMDWLGKATRPAKTMIVLGEGRNGFIDRIDAWRAAHGVDEAVLREWIVFVDGANLSNDTSLELLQTLAAEHQAELIIFDTWSNTMGVLKEEDNGLNNEALRRARLIREGATLWFIHHPRKAEEDSDAPVMRGAGALHGRAEVTLTLWEDKKFSSEDGIQRRWLALSSDGAHKGKNKVATTETIRGLYLSEDYDAPVFMQTQGEVLSRSAKRVRENLTRSMSVKEYMAATGVAENTARNQLARAVAEGVARRHEGAGNAPDYYAPTGHWKVLQERAS